MRWFFALNETSTSFWEYANLVQVAVHSAQTRTALQPICLYDGADNVLTTWLETAGVKVIRRRTFLHEWVTDLAPIPRGAYLRLEIPAVCAEQGWADEYVLYTDCDVIFRRDPGATLATLRPEFFAAAPETDQTDFTNFNSGVMWINVPGLRAESAALRATIRTHLSEAITPPYDQAALQRHFRGRASPLPLELNWKPYWGPSAAASMLHFHGPKPAQKYHALNQRMPAEVARWVDDAYFAAVAEWDALLIDALRVHPWPEDAAQGIANGFDTLGKITAGLGNAEGPHPEINLPVVRWGLAPQTIIEFTSTGAPLRLETVLQSSDATQAVSVYLDDRPLTHLALTRAHDPYALSLDLPISVPGPHRICFQYAKSVTPPPPDPRKLGVLFRALRIRSV